MKKMFLLISGIAITSSLISGAHVVQGLILDDWSGLHPYYRLYQVPVIIAIGFLVGLIVLSILWAIKANLSVGRLAYFKLGFILGFVGISNLIHPYINSKYTDWVVILGVFIASIFIALRFLFQQKKN